MSPLLHKTLGHSRYLAPEPGDDGAGAKEEEKEETGADAGDSDLLGMSDEDFLNAPPPAATEPQATADEDNDLDPDNPDAGDDKGITSEGGAEQAKDEGAEEGAADEGKPESDAGDADKDKAKPEGKEAPKDEGKKGETPEVPVDYKAAYDKLTAPFKANGRDFQVKSVDDAIQLMQMGVNYNKKMAALKPSLKLLKLLENNGLLDENKLSFLIDVDKKDPAAINKLVKDSGLDPMDLSAEKASEYKQTTRTVDDREIELDTVLGDLQDSPAYTRTIEVAAKWDAKSKQVIADAPQLLKVIHGHIESGVFDLISKELESERLLGRLSGLSDLEAYRQIGDAMNASGRFNHLGQGSSPAKAETPAAPVIVTPAPKKVEDDKLKEKRRAASPTRPAAPTAAKPDFNPLSLSDEEFEKQVNAKFL